MPPTTLRRQSPTPQTQSGASSKAVAPVAVAPSKSAAALVGVNISSSAQRGSTFTSFARIADLLDKVKGELKAGAFAELEFWAKIPTEVGLVIELKVSGKLSRDTEYKLELDAKTGVAWAVVKFETFRHFELSGGNLGLAFQDAVLQSARQDLIDLGIEPELRELVFWKDRSVFEESVDVVSDFLVGKVRGSASLLGKILVAGMTRHDLVDLWNAYDKVFGDIPGVGFEISKGARLNLEGELFAIRGTLSGDFTLGLEDIGEKKDKAVEFVELGWSGKLELPAAKASPEVKFSGSKRWRTDGSTQTKLELHGEFPASPKTAAVITALHEFVRARGLWKALASVSAAKKDGSSVFDSDALIEAATILAAVPLPFGEQKFGLDITFSNEVVEGKPTWKVEARLRLYKEFEPKGSLPLGDVEVGLGAKLAFGTIIDVSAEVRAALNENADRLEKEKKQTQKLNSAQKAKR